MSGDREAALSVLVDGSLTNESLAGLAAHFSALSTVSIPEESFHDAGRLNPFVDDAPANWILLVRRDEQVSEELAAEIARNASSSAHAWGFRIRRRLLYCGETLHLGQHDAGEVRLFHRRKARLQPDGRMKVQGTVVRLESRLVVVLHESRETHMETLRRSGRRRAGVVRRLSNWLTAILREGPRALDSTTRRYLWREAGWVMEDPAR